MSISVQNNYFGLTFFHRDYMVEGMEIVEMYCDLLLARFGLVESMKYKNDVTCEKIRTSNLDLFFLQRTRFGLI
jgi:hypothetical protein